MALRPRTQQVVGIVDELLRQSGGKLVTPPMASPVIYQQTPLEKAMGRPEISISEPRGSTMTTTYPTGPVGTALARTTPELQNVMRGGIPTSNAPASVIDVPRMSSQEVGVRQQTPDEMALNMPRVPGSDMDIMAATQEAEAKMRDLGGKATQAALLEAKNKNLKTDPTFQDRIKGFFGDRGNMLRLALAFNSLRTTPDAGLTTMLTNELKDLRTENRAINVATRLRQIGTPEAIRAAEYIEGTGDVKGGMNMYNKAGSVTQKTGVELGGEAAGYDPKKIYNVDTITGKVSSIGGGDTSITVEGDKSKLFDATYKYITDNRDAFVQEGIQANKSLQAFGRMNRALDFTDTGKEEQNRQAIRTMLDGFGLSGLIDEQAYANAASFNAAANALVAEELRANKGPQTDFDARFAQTYIPGLGNPKEANREILKYGQSTAQIKRLLGQLANRVTPTSDTVIQDMEKVNGYALTVPNVVIKADGTVMHFYDFYRKNQKADIADLFEAWTTFADQERARQLDQ